MSSVTMTIAMDAGEVDAALAKAGESLPRYINSWLVQSATVAKEEMASRVNEGVGAAMGQGIKNNIDTTYDEVQHTALVKPNRNVPYADALETGSQPHRPPTNPDGSLAQWCEMKGLNLYAVAATIAREGTQAHPFIAPTFDVVKGPIAQMFEDGIGAWCSQMGIAL